MKKLILFLNLIIIPTLSHAGPATMAEDLNTYICEYYNNSTMVKQKIVLAKSKKDALQLSAFALEINLTGKKGTSEYKYNGKTVTELLCFN